MTRVVILLVPALALAAAGCGSFTDAATRLAYDLESAATRLAADEGARFTLVHATPSRPGQCEGPYTVQIDGAGAIIIWCRDQAGATVSSHSTTYHSRFVETARTIMVEKPAGASLRVELERRGGGAIVVGAS